jgi:hypothetical protein
MLLHATVIDPDGPSWWRTAVRLAGFAAAALSLLVAPGAAAALAALGLAWATAGAVVRPRLRPREGTIALERGAIRIRGAGAASQRIAAHDLVAAAWAHTTDGVAIALVRGASGDRPLVLRFATEGDAARVRRVLGVGARGFGDVAWLSVLDAGGWTALVLRALAWVGWIGTAVAFALGATEVALALTFQLLPLQVLAFAFTAAGRGDRLPFMIGSDFVASGVSRVVWSDVRSARVEGGALVVTTTAGSEVSLPAPGATPAETALAAALLQETVRRGPSDGACPPGLAALERTADEDRLAWLRRLDAMSASLRETEGYRRGGVDPADLWVALEDPDAPAMLRAASARMLAHVAPEEAGPRIADALAAERDAATRARVRIALEEDPDLAAREIDRLEERK